MDCGGRGHTEVCRQPVPLTYLCLEGRIEGKVDGGGREQGCEQDCVRQRLGLCCGCCSDCFMQVGGHAWRVGWGWGGKSIQG